MKQILAALALIAVFLPVQAQDKKMEKMDKMEKKGGMAKKDEMKKDGMAKKDEMKKGEMKKK